MNETAVVFPGQGAQAVGMGRDLIEHSQAARDVYAQAGDVLGFDLAQRCLEGPAEELERTDIQQPAIFTTSVAFFEAYLEQGGRRDIFARGGGLSLGEYTALYAAGVFDFPTGLRLVRRRGELMQQAAKAAPSGMLTLVGADEATADEVCGTARGDDVLNPANLNCPGQVVISGSGSAIDRAKVVCEQRGLRCVELPVAGAFHSALMAPAADGLDGALVSCELGSPRFPVIRNVDAAYHESSDATRSMLCRQLTSPVLWQRCVERMIADGVTRFVEFGPGRVLTGLLRKIDRIKAKGVAIHTWDALMAFVASERG